MPRVLSVGQCGFDHGTIAHTLKAEFGVEVVPAGTQSEAVAALQRGGFDLVLVNRVFDEDGGSGIDLIRTLKADPALSSVPVMLVSNYPDAQREAETLGALPGFGKAELRTPKAKERLEAALPHPTKG